MFLLDGRYTDVLTRRRPEIYTRRKKEEEETITIPDISINSVNQAERIIQYTRIYTYVPNIESLYIIYYLYICIYLHIYI